MNKYTLCTRIGWAIALIFLVGALCYYNIPYLMDPASQDTPAAGPVSSSTASLIVRTETDEENIALDSSQEETTEAGGTAGSIEESIPIGGDVGMRCPDFTAPLYGDGPESFTLSDHLGKVIIINFWTTFCTPCIKELPYFEAYAKEHEDDVVLITLHGMVVAEKDMDGWFDKHPFDITFGLDKTGSIQASLNGNMVYPQTIIVDKHGVIVYNETIPLTLERIGQLADPLLEQE